MRLSQLGERKIIELFARRLGTCEDLVLGIGDDACVFRLGPGDHLIVTTDLLTEKAHIPKEMTPRQIGMMAVNVNLSDLAAMGAKPLGLVFSFGLPPELEAGFVEEMAEGMEKACKEHGTCTAGGDTKEHREMVIAGTAFGRAGERYLTRGGARAGDLLCVTGTIGSATAGFYCITRGLAPEGRERFLRAALEPRARVKEGLVLVHHASACTDITDGLAWSLHELARRSGKGFLVYEDRVPIDEGIKEVAREAGVPMREVVFHKGGDYELLFAIPPAALEMVMGSLKDLGTKVTVIGEVTPKGGRIVAPDGKEGELEARGYESFVSRF